MRVACIYFNEPTNQLQNFAEVCLKFSPQICLRNKEAVFIEIGRCRSLYTEDEFRKRIQIVISAFNLKASVAISDGVVNALILSKYGTLDLSKLPLTALPLFSDPYGHGHMSEGIEKIIEILGKVAIQNVGEFSALSEAQISTRFGRLGMYYKRQIENPNIPWRKWAPRESISEVLALSHEDACSSIEPLIFKSKEALDRIFDQIIKQGLRLVKLRVSLDLEKFSTVKRKTRTWDFEFAFPQESTKAVIPILRERWDKEFSRDPLEALVRQITFQALEMTPGFEAQSNYIDQSSEITANHQAMLSLLSEKNGKDKVFQATLKKRRLPELSWQKMTDTKETDTDLLGKIPQRPTKLIPKPLLLRLTEDRIFLSKKNKSFKVVSWSEVEKLKDQWLDGTIERDYFKVTIEEGSPLWVFKNELGEYFLHGWFE